MPTPEGVSGIDTSKAQAYTSTKKDTKKSDLDKDAFLQLLVAQMQYQDPLNPGDSTEYMSQLAQYSSLEATMNISDNVKMGNSLNLVGQYVIMNTTDSAGKSKMVSGLVQYATVKNGEVLLSIDDNYYPAADLDSVVDYDYYLYLNKKEESTDNKNEGTNTDKNNTGNTSVNDATDNNKKAWFYLGGDILKGIENSYISIEQAAGLYLHNTNNKINYETNKSVSFEDILRNAAFSQEKIKFSKHANERLQSRNISLDDSQMNRLTQGVDQAREKNIKESLVMMDDLAFIVNIKNNTVVTALLKNQEGNVFTNIDGAVIV